MALDQKKRQKKLEKQKAKQKAKKRALARQASQNLASQFKRAADEAPILHCVTIADIWDQGIGNVLISRKLSGGRVAFVAFLVDIYCLGVKDVIMNVLPADRYRQEMFGRLNKKYKLLKLKPECLRKLVEGSVDFAADCGIAPHRDYRTARLIFGDVDATACTREFEFGKDGKPFFFAGPRDSEFRCREIMSKLEASCGPDGYHFVMPVMEPPDDVDLISEMDGDSTGQW